MAKMHTCPRCGKTSDRKSNIISHLSKVVVCEAKLCHLTQEDCLRALNCNKYKYSCNVCNESFTSAKGLKYHEKHKVCSKNSQSQATAQQHTPTTSITNNTNNTNHTNSNNKTNNVQINFNFAEGKLDFGQERLDHITPDMIRGYLSNMYTGITRFLDDVYFNDDVPENQNVKVHNLKQKLMKVVRDGREALVPNSVVSRSATFKFQTVLLQYIEPLIDLIQNIMSRQSDPDLREPFIEGSDEPLSDTLRYELQRLNHQLDHVREHMMAQLNKDMKVSEGRKYASTCKVVEAHIVGKNNDDPMMLPSCHVTNMNHSTISQSQSQPPLRLTKEVLEMHTSHHNPLNSGDEMPVPDFNPRFKWSNNMYNIPRPMEFSNLSHMENDAQ